MKAFGLTIIALAALLSPGAISREWQHHQLESRAFRAGKALRSVYVRTESESIRVASAYAYSGKICVGLSSSGPAFQPGDEASTDMSYAVFDGSNQFRFNVERAEFDEECGGADAGVNVLGAAERGVAKGEQ